MSFDLTQQQLESMSDFELNVVAANQFYNCDNITTSLSKDDIGSAWVLCNEKLENTNYNPCNNWSDCGDLIDELINGTTNDIEFDETVLIFGMLDDEICIKHDNIKSAITIAYILVKQSQK